MRNYLIALIFLIKIISIDASNSASKKKTDTDTVVSPSDIAFNFGTQDEQELEFGIDENGKETTQPIDYYPFRPIHTLNANALLFEGVETNDEQKIDLALSLSADINRIQSRNKNTVLMIAARSNKVQIASKLLTHEDIDINAVDNDCWTALMVAIRYGSPEIALLILESTDINVNIAQTSGWTALMFAVNEGLDTVVQKLLEKPGINVNTKNHDGWTALRMASRKNFDIIASLLLFSGAV